MPDADITAYQRDLLLKRVRFALSSVPLYRQHCEAATGATLISRINNPHAYSGEAFLTEIFHHLPIWTRANQQALYEASPNSPLAGAIQHATGGSTGEPTRFYLTRESYEWRTAVSDRGYSWAKAEPGQRAFFVWGAPIKPLRFQARFRETVRHALENRRFFNSFEFNKDAMAACCERINRFRPHALVGYAGNLVELARFVRDDPAILTHRARSVVAAAEGLQPGQCALLESALGREVFMSYGSREFMLIGMECSRHRGYHLSADNLYVEIVDDSGTPLPMGQPGRILVTDLHNDATPFIRYEIGDAGVMSDAPCPCGMPFQRLLNVEGRTQDFIEKPDGSRLTALFLPHLMKEFAEVGGYQVVQEAAATITLNVIAQQPLASATESAMRRKLVEMLGADMAVTVRRVNSLRTSATGKTPVIVRERRI